MSMHVACLSAGANAKCTIQVEMCDPDRSPKFPREFRHLDSEESGLLFRNVLNAVDVSSLWQRLAYHSLPHRVPRSFSYAAPYLGLLIANSRTIAIDAMCSLHAVLHLEKIHVHSARVRTLCDWAR